MIIITIKTVIIPSGVTTVINSGEVVTEAVAMIGHVMETIETMAMEAIVNGRIIGTETTDKAEIMPMVKPRAIDTTETIRTTEEIDREEMETTIKTEKAAMVMAETRTIMNLQRTRTAMMNRRKEKYTFRRNSPTTKIPCSETM